MDSKNLLKIVGVIVVLLLVFQIGISVGYRKARFAGPLGDNYRRMGFFPGNDLPGGHGAAGEIVSIALPLVVVAGPDNLEKTVIVDDTTRIREFRDAIQANELTVGDFIIVLGTPNDAGQVEAKLIRLAPRI